jgi:hypothetical protein
MGGTFKKQCKYYRFFECKDEFFSKTDFVVSELGTSCKGFKFWGWIKKLKTIATLFIQYRNLKLLLQFLIFEGA